MRHALGAAFLAGLVIAVALLCTRGNALADSCNLTAPANGGQLLSLANYDPTLSSNSYVIAANTIKFSCTFANNGSKVRIFFLGTSTTQGTYTPPFLTGPSSSHLNFSICTTSAACGSGGPFWDASSVYTFNEIDGNKSGTDNLTIATQLAVYVPAAQNIYVGSYPAINVYFAFQCAKTSTFSDC